MPRRSIPSAVLAVALLAASSARAQQTIGTIPSADAELSGMLSTTGGPTTTLLTQATLTAREHTATVALSRGGAVRVCMSSVAHLSMPAAAAGADPSATRPLLIALDRGAIEIKTTTTATDAILTPDMRMQPVATGPLDLRLRVVDSGDTCIENRGSTAPTLMIADSFGESSYVLRAGQHILFEHGNLHQVVDNETSPCGCPPEQSPAAAEPHPFPEAVSAGLVPAPAPVTVPPPHPVAPAKVGVTLSFNSDESKPATEASATSTPINAQPAAEASNLPPPHTEGDPDVVTLVRRLCHWLFRRGH